MTDIWLRCKEVAELAGKNNNTIRRRVKKGKYVTKLVKGNGGIQYNILLDSLEMNLRLKYVSRRRNESILELKEIVKDIEKLCDRYLQECVKGHEEIAQLLKNLVVRSK